MHYYQKYFSEPVYILILLFILWRMQKISYQKYKSNFICKDGIIN